MANSRFDNIRYWDANSSSYKIPKQIKVWNASNNTWIDYGEKNSTNSRKLNVYDTNRFICATYKRRDVNIPSYLQVGSGGKHTDLFDSNSSVMSVDNYNGGFYWEMNVSAESTCSLYTVYTRNNGDITNQAYVNFRINVSGNVCNFEIQSLFCGYRITDGAWINTGLRVGGTPYCFTKNERVTIVVTRPNSWSDHNVKIYNPSGQLLCDHNITVMTQWVGNPTSHKLGATTIDRNGTIQCDGVGRIYTFKMTPSSNRSLQYYANFTGSPSGSTRIYSSGNYGGFTDCRNTSVYGANYTVYDRQTV